ncbi:MAG: acyl-CoA dehydratase activase-related protein [Spirochaeta sp.]|nr:acyl-CoA dehydratase activase-related protein [Spirochaeta sp.]
MVKLHNELLVKNYNEALGTPRAADQSGAGSREPGMAEAQPTRTDALVSREPGMAEARPTRIGIPRALEFWNSMPYWTTLFRALGMEPVVSRESTYSLFESGLQAIPSDTVCFPAKVAHGHVLDLVAKKVDRIFMPMMIRVPKENKHAESDAVCPVIQGYPKIIEHSDAPLERYGIPMDLPAFHWHDEKLRRRQTIDFITERYDIPPKQALAATKAAESALSGFRDELQQYGRHILNKLNSKDGAEFGVVLAGRPYHSDNLVNHHLSRFFTGLGIPVMTLDGLADLGEVDVRPSRVDSYVPFHTRMLAAALSVARHPKLELVQIVSFGCGHDAVLSDEMARILRETSDKELLVLKLDEGEASGPLTIRIKSFIETVRTKRGLNTAPTEKPLANTADLKPITVSQLSAPKLANGFPQKFTRADKKRRVILAPNLSPAFTRVTAAVVSRQGYHLEPLPIAGERAFELGKKYVHNDICFPAQVNIGEFLSELESGRYRSDEVAIGLAKNCDACRAGQYAGLARSALDEAGYKDIPIITIGDDTKNMHPGFRLSPHFQLRMLWALAITDALETMRRRTRAYEDRKGETDRVFDVHLERICTAISLGHRDAMKGLETAVDAFNRIPLSDSAAGADRKPRVGITGEILMKYHPSANGYIEKYLEEHGMEVVVPGMIDFFRRENVINKHLGVRKLSHYPFVSMLLGDLADHLYEFVLRKVDKAMEEFRFVEHRHDIHDLAARIGNILDPSFVSGEGWLIPTEIMQMTEDGVNAFVVLNPFGCLPNHISGRGMMKPLKARYPHIQVLSLDYDPDTSFANIENRLQMLVITAREQQRLHTTTSTHADTAGQQRSSETPTAVQVQFSPVQKQGSTDSI